jgi:hypothetical protein
MTPPAPAAPSIESSLDAMAHAAMANATVVLSPVSAGLAALDWAAHLALSPGRQAELARLAWAGMAATACGLPATAAQDERDDGAPIEILEQYFEARGWACERTAEGEIVASATGSWAQYELRGVWRSEDQVLQFLAFPDIKVGPDKRADIYEALSLINEQLWLGHFEMWSGSGLVVFRHSTILDLREDDGLSLEQAEAIAEAAVEECERFYPVFQFVLWGGKSPGEAISAALIDTHGEA